MSMHDVDLARLLTPIGGSAHGCGEDLAFSEAFDHIQKARIEDDTSLEQGAWVTQHRQADWRLVRSQCEQLLATQSKDLRLGFWWAEAMTKMHGFTGLSVGLSLLTQLIDQFWLGIYPEAEDEDQDARITLLNWFVKHTDGLIRQIKLTDSDKGCFDYNDFVSARSLAETLRRNPDLEDDLVGQQLTLSVYQSALHSTPIDWLQDGLTALIESLAQWQQLGQVIDEKLGHDAPVFSKTQELLQEVQQHLQAVAGLETVEQDNPLPDTAPDIVAEDTESAGQRAQPSVGFSPKAGSHVQNRQHALQVLQQVSDYFALNEPHSPVTYLLQKTIRWASMPLHQWLAQVVKQDDVLTQMQDVLGVEPSHEES